MMKKPSIHSVIKNMLSHFGESIVATTDVRGFCQPIVWLGTPGMLRSLSTRAT
jgi:hypothetical protein